MIHFSPIEQHIRNRAHTRLCDGRLTSEADISSEDSDALRETRLEFDLNSYRTNAAQNRQAEDVLERQLVIVARQKWLSRQLQVVVLLQCGINSQRRS